MDKVIFRIIGAIIVGSVLSYYLDITPLVGALFGAGLYWLNS